MGNGRKNASLFPGKIIPSEKNTTGFVMMEIKRENYCVTYDPTTAIMTFQGVIRIYEGADYNSMVDLFRQVAEQKPATITLNLQALQSLNSSGMNAFSKFVLAVRQHAVSQLVIQGSKQFPWQQKAVNLFLRMMPSLKVEWLS
jgi:hypothetical protein